MSFHEKQSAILVTGGAGYIGSHTTLALLESNFNVLVLDNFCNSSPISLQRLGQIAGREPVLIEGDIRDRSVLDQIFSENAVEAVLHFAGLKAVGESISQPQRYYENNVHGSKVLLQACADAGVFKFVFSSSATVYGDPLQIPISEQCPAGHPSSPYGRSKLIVENLLRDLSASDPRWRIGVLRYFNPVGAHHSGLIGEDPNDIPNNLLPYITQVAVGKLPRLSIFGSDYPTPDGTGVRDYVHVMDLAEGHLRALEALNTLSGIHVWNLGTGQGYSVLDMVRAFETTSGRTVPYVFSSRRPGDIAICFADTSKAAQELNWKARRSLEDMMRDAWHWQQMNPNGYNDQI